MVDSMKNAEIMREQISVDMFERLVSILDPSMDNYLYLYDLIISHSNIAVNINRIINQY